MRRTTFLTVMAVLAAPAAAQAGGFAVARYAGEHGHAATDHPTAIYFNPAGLALGTGWRIYAEGLFALRTVEYERPEGAINNIQEEGDLAGGTPEDAVDANAGTAKLNNFVVSPFLGVVADFGVPNFSAGLAFHAPFGGQAKWEKNSDFEGDPQYPGAEDGVQRWSTIEGSLRSIYLTLAGAYRLPGPRLSFGVALNVIRSSITTIRARNAAGTDDLVSGTGRLVEGRSLVETEGIHLGAGVGVLWQPTETVWIGASYQSQPFGDARQSGTLTSKLGSAPSQVSDVDLEQHLPDIVRVAGRVRPVHNVELRLAGDWQRWSVFENQCLMDANVPDNNCDLDENGAATEDARGVVVNIPRRWKDSFGVRAGGSYWLTPALELNGGFNFDTSAVPDETIDASLLDQNKVIVLAGVRWAIAPDTLILGLTLNNVFYFERTVEPRERDAMDRPIGSQPPSSVPDGAGTYKQNVFYVNLGAEARF